MAYDEYQADRIRHVLQDKNIGFEERKMFGGICYMVDDKMCVGTMINKESGEPYLMARIGEELFIKNQHRKG
ncbi:MAG: TfoX/Sxy family protein, partial [Bacteroidia bacterium]|nr:TfoX/Sxy family protein [Bacteroidia bacterium]